MTTRAGALVLLLSLGPLPAGCASPQVQLLAEPRGAPILARDGAVMADGVRLPLETWRAANPTAVILALHGFNGYANDFKLPAPWFAARGLTFYAYDQRGFGRTGQRGLWPGAAALASDLKAVHGLIAARHPAVPVHVLGASMGGAVVMKAMAEGMKPDGAILVAPAVWGWQAMNPLYKGALWAAAHTIPATVATGGGVEIHPTDNLDFLRDYSGDALNIKRTRIDAVYGLVGLMDEANAAAVGASAPVLYLYGARDRLVPEAPTREVMGRIRAPKRLVRYANGWHMLLHDRQRERVWHDILAWIADPNGNLPSGEELAVALAAETR